MSPPGQGSSASLLKPLCSDNLGSANLTDTIFHEGLEITILTGIIESIKADDLAAKLPKVGLMVK